MSDAANNEKILADLRKRIDTLDNDLVRLLNERADVVVKIGTIKKEQGVAPIYAPDREQVVLERVRKANKGPLPDLCLQAVWKELMSGSFALECPLKIGYLGPKGTFSHQAARAQFGACVEYVPVDSIRLVFQAVESGKVDLGLVPIENTTGGGIHESLDCFLHTSARVCAEVLVPISHNVLSNEKSLADIKEVYSRPEVFEQCTQWLNEHLKHAERRAMSSSAQAVAFVKTRPNAAAVGSILAAEEYDIPILQSHIEDNPKNTTRFFVIGQQTTKPTNDDKTAILFTTRNQPGALASVIDEFRDRKINLTHIDKRPSQRQNFEYYFFIDCEGHRDEPHVEDAVEAAREHCVSLTVLGSFPRAKDNDAKAKKINLTN